MALVKDEAGREFAPPPKWRPLRQQGRGPVVANAKPAPRQREVFRVQAAPAPAPAPVTLVQPQPALQAWQQQQPVAVMPQQQPVLVQVAPERPMTALEQAGVFESREPRTLDAALRSAWGNLENEGAAGMMKERETGRRPEPVQVEHNQQMINMADHYNLMARLGARDRKRADREAADRKESRGSLTAEEWAAYSPLQQAAAQANADLFAAVQRDFSTQGKHGRIDDQGRQVNDKIDDYQKRVAELFGENDTFGFKGLEYAPNTVAFLDSRGIDRQALGGRSLADLVSGDTLFTRDVIDNLGRKGQPASSDVAFAQSLAKGQLQYQEKLASQLAKGKQLLSGMSARGTSAVAADTYGAAPEETATKLTAVRPETLGQIDKYMEALARPDLDPAESMRTIELDLQQRGADQAEVDQVFQSMADRVRLGMQGDGKWFPNVDYQLRSPDEVAKMLNVPVLKRKEG